MTAFQETSVHCCPSEIIYILIETELKGTQPPLHWLLAPSLSPQRLVPRGSRLNRSLFENGKQTNSNILCKNPNSTASLQFTLTACHLGFSALPKSLYRTCRSGSAEGEIHATFVATKGSIKIPFKYQSESRNCVTFGISSLGAKGVTLNELITLFVGLQL